MEEEESCLTCANCDASFEKNGDQVTKFHVTTAETPYQQKNVSILEALATVCRAKSAKLGGFNKMVMCTRCATVVADLYRSFVELMQLSKSTAYIAKVLMQAEIWHKTRQASGEQENNPEDGSLEESEYNEDYLCSVLAVELTEGCGRDGDDDDFSDSESFGDQHDHEMDDSKKLKISKFDSPDYLRRIVPKKRKMTDNCYPASASDLPTHLNSRNRRKNAMPVKILPTEIAASPGGSEEGQVAEPNLRRSDRRRRISSLSQNLDTKLNPDIEEHSDQSEMEQFEPQTKKRKKKTAGRFFKAKGKLKGNIKRRKTKDIVLKDDEGELEIDKRKRSGSQNEKIVCTSCEETFDYHWMLDHHIQLVHENKIPRSCPQCGFKYLSFRMYEVHHCIPKESQAEERLERPFRCKFCGKTLMNKGHFAVHCGSHDVDEDKRYKCPYPDCKLTFKFAKNLVKHERTHLEDKSWQCSICGKVFRVKRNLTIHMEIHKEEKKYLCPTCGLSFAQRRGLFRHLNTHSGINKHNCPICGKTFKRKDHVTQHLNSKVHPKTLMVGSHGSVEEGLEKCEISLLAFDQCSTSPTAILPDNSQSPTGNSELPLQPQHLVSVHQPHNFISNPSVVLSQHPTEFAFSDLLTL